MSNLIAIANYIGLNFTGSSTPSVNDIVTELGIQIVTESTSQDIVTE